MCYAQGFYPPNGRIQSILSFSGVSYFSEYFHFTGFHPPHLRMENLAPGFQYMVRPLPECSPPARFNAEGHYIKPRFQGYISTTISPPIVFYTTFTPRMLGRNSSLRFQTPLGTPPEHSWRERHRGLGSAGPSRAPSHNQ